MPHNFPWILQIHFPAIRNTRNISIRSPRFRIEHQKSISRTSIIVITSPPRLLYRSQSKKQPVVFHEEALIGYQIQAAYRFHYMIGQREEQNSLAVQAAFASDRRFPCVPESCDLLCLQIVPGPLAECFLNLIIRKVSSGNIESVGNISMLCKQPSVIKGEEQSRAAVSGDTALAVFVTQAGRKFGNSAFVVQEVIAPAVKFPFDYQRGNIPPEWQSPSEVLDFRVNGCDDPVDFIGCIPE